MSKQKIQLSDHFDYSRLLRFVLPCIGTMLFTSIYGIVDGLCVSNFVGKTAFAAVNLIMPVPMLVGSVGFMLGTGGSAIVGITLGEGDREKADRYFSLFVWTGLLAGIVLSAVGVLIVRPAAALLGAEGEMLDYAVRYGRLLMLSLPFFILQNMFQSFFVTAEKPHLGFAFTVAAGVTNMVLDVVLVGMLHGGVEGAAIATSLSNLVSALLILTQLAKAKEGYRFRPKQTKIHRPTLTHILGIGVPAAVESSMYAFSNLLIQVPINNLGTDAVAAWSATSKVDGIYWSLIVSFGVAIMAFVGQNYGAGKYDRMKASVKVCMQIAMGTTIVLSVLLIIFAKYCFLLFTDNPQVIQYATQVVYYFAPFYFI